MVANFCNHVNQRMKSSKPRIIVTVSTIAFLLHLIWEYLQCIPFFIHIKSPPNNISMIRATSGDVILTWIGYFSVSLISLKLYWIETHWHWKYWFAMLASALILSVSIEYFALKTERWAYTEINPVLFGTISIFPVLQLLILFPLTFYLAKRVLKKNL